MDNQHVDALNALAHFILIDPPLAYLEEDGRTVHWGDFRISHTGLTYVVEVKKDLANENWTPPHEEVDDVSAHGLFERACEQVIRWEVERRLEDLEDLEESPGRE